MKNIIILFLIVSSLFSCKTSSENKPAKSKLGISAKNEAIDLNSKALESAKITFLDSLNASKEILKDDFTNIFSKLRRLDISIQMNQNYPEETSLEQIKEDYNKFIQKDVMNFSQEEQNWLTEIWAEAVSLCYALNENILQTETVFIKTRGNYYGKDAFYTRNNAIIVPEENIKKRSRSGMLSVLLHEIFHIYSRYNPEKQEALYKLIGFNKIGDSAELQIPEILDKRILHNPDGVNFAFSIELTNGQQKFQAVPIISSTLDAYTSSKPEFFDYLFFDLYEVKNVDGKFHIICDEEGQPQLPAESMLSFFEQIGNNTQYIIHPDEILADNFMLLALAKKDPESINRLSPEGKKLLDKIKASL